jgi:hypothetical protein
MAAVAAELLVEFGQTATYRKEAIESADEVDGSVRHTTTEYSVTVALFDTDGSEFGRLESQSPVNESTTVVIKQKLLMGSVSFTPEIGDRVVVDGDTLFVRAIKTTAPAGTVVLYDLGVTR